MRGKRNFTRTAVHAAPRPFLFVALDITGTARLTTHLVGKIDFQISINSDKRQTDQFFISHKHQQDDGLPNLEDSQEKEVVFSDNASTASVVRSPPLGVEKRDGTVVFSSDV
jgi:hypothetical protein